MHENTTTYTEYYFIGSQLSYPTKCLKLKKQLIRMNGCLKRVSKIERVDDVPIDLLYCAYLKLTVALVILSDNYSFYVGFPLHQDKHRQNTLPHSQRRGGSSAANEPLLSLRYSGYVAGGIIIG